MARDVQSSHVLVFCVNFERHTCTHFTTSIKCYLNSLTSVYVPFTNIQCQSNWHVCISAYFFNVNKPSTSQSSTKVDRVSVPLPIAIDILTDTMARDRVHMYLFSVYCHSVRQYINSNWRWDRNSVYYKRNSWLVKAG